MEFNINVENNTVGIRMTSDEALKLLNNLTELFVKLSESSADEGSIEIPTNSGEEAVTIHVEKMYCL